MGMFPIAMLGIFFGCLIGLIIICYEEIKDNY